MLNIGGSAISQTLFSNWQISTYGEEVGKTGIWNLQEISLRVWAIAPPSKGANEKCEPPSPLDPRTVIPRIPVHYKDKDNQCMSFRRVKHKIVIEFMICNWKLAQKLQRLIDAKSLVLT